jgi:hypothetical protein
MKPCELGIAAKRCVITGLDPVIHLLKMDGYAGQAHV